MRSSSPADGMRRSKRASRQMAIAEAVVLAGTVRIEEIARHFGVSLMTAHRDLDSLQARGFLRKLHGVATAISTTSVESGEFYRFFRQQREKQEIAGSALSFLKAGQSVFFDDSTTVRYLAMKAVVRRPLSIITNSLPLMTELAEVEEVALIAIGGSYAPWCRAFLGRPAVEQISKLRADIAFVSTSAVTDDLCFHQSPEIVDTKRAMLESSKTRILLADHTKFEQRALHAFARLSEFDAVVVDRGVTDGDLQQLRSHGANVLVAPTLDPSSGVKLPQAGTSGIRVREPSGGEDQ